MSSNDKYMRFMIYDFNGCRDCVVSNKNESKSSMCIMVRRSQCGMTLEFVGCVLALASVVFAMIQKREKLHHSRIHENWRSTGFG